MRRIKIAIVGSSSLSKDEAKKLASSILENLNSRYELTTVVTIQEDPLGKAVRRRILFAGGIKLKTYSEDRFKTQSNAGELASCSLMWETRNFILVHNGDCSYSQFLCEALDRHALRYRLLEVAR